MGGALTKHAERCLQQFTLNFQMLLYPSRGIIDARANLGNDGWDFNSLAPIFPIRTVHDPLQGVRDIVRMTYYNKTTKSTNSPICVFFSEGNGVTNDAFMKTFSRLGLDINTDLQHDTAPSAFPESGCYRPGYENRELRRHWLLQPQSRKPT